MKSRKSSEKAEGIGENDDALAFVGLGSIFEETNTVKQDVSPSENGGESDGHGFSVPYFHRENESENTVKNSEKMSFHDVNSTLDGETLDLNAETLDGAQLHVSYNVEQFQRDFDRSRKVKEQQDMSKAHIKKLIQTRESKIRRGEGRKETHLVEIERLTKLLND